MLAVAQCPTTTKAPPQAELTPVGPRLTACVLADVYLQYASAPWRGDADGRALRAGLSGFQCDDMPLEPDVLPGAFSPQGGGGPGIRWHEAGLAILGYEPGMSVGYRVPRDVVPPA